VAVIDRLEAFERAERGADLHLELTRANALLDSGHSEDALKGFDRALEVARADDEGALDHMRLGAQVQALLRPPLSQARRSGTS